MNYKVLDLGLIDFNRAFFVQKEVLAQVKSALLPGAIILAEHQPVFTLGRLACDDNILIGRTKIKALGIDIVRTDRGGDITFHGPGQLVCYPIFNLNMLTRDMHKFLRDMEEVVMSLLRGYGIESFRISGRTGCWTEWGKIASIGIAASNWITYHGLALNANTGLEYFDMINPCGYKGIKTTSMQKILKSPVAMERLKREMIHCFETVFKISAMPF
ncbi:MAG: lipoyl(octanoyl) transferase LipB [Candidatus Omnitrophica bacterium]|nr:lipoyl(octanoyl) transferase LipB [Candidatus Omnitrophota bacterium]